MYFVIRPLSKYTEVITNHAQRVRNSFAVPKGTPQFEAFIFAVEVYVLFHSVFQIFRREITLFEGKKPHRC